MGHECPIEPRLAPDNRAACGSPSGPAASCKRDENRWQRTPQAPHEWSSVLSSRNGKREQTCSTVWAGSQEKIRPQDKCFFLDSFYRAYRDLSIGVEAI